MLFMLIPVLNEPDESKGEDRFKKTVVQHCHECCANITVPNYNSVKNVINLNVLARFKVS